MENFKSVYGVIGNPVGHSLSPYMHNLAFEWECVKGVYHAFKVIDIEKAVQGMRGLGIKGFSVTIPHKETIMPYLDKISEDALKIGAVNTVINKDGYLYGDNTDWKGVLHSLRDNIEIKNKKVLVIGAGGAARGVSHAVNYDGGNLYITNRTEEKGLNIAKEFAGNFVKMDEIFSLNPDVVINSTSVGMYPNINKSPVNISDLKSVKLALDIVYNPVETKFLKEARQKGIKAVSGIGMFVYQGEAQFRMWTGNGFDTLKMKEKIFHILNN